MLWDLVYECQVGLSIKSEKPFFKHIFLNTILLFRLYHLQAQAKHSNQFVYQNRTDRGDHTARDVTGKCQ